MVDDNDSKRDSDFLDDQEIEELRGELEGFLKLARDIGMEKDAIKAFVSVIIDES